MKAWPVLGIITVQLFLCLAHWFMYLTWVHFWWPLSLRGRVSSGLAVAALSVAFMAASLLSFRLSSWPVRLFYRATSVWMGLVNFLFMATWGAWLLDLTLRLVVSAEMRAAIHPYIAMTFLAAALTITIYGLVHARSVRISRVSIELTNLPSSWRDRKVLLISDLHLGHVNGAPFARKIAALGKNLDPDVIFIAGDLFDGSKVDPLAIIAPLRDLKPPLGMFFVRGNHEAFGGAVGFEQAIRDTGIRVLDNECVHLDGLRLIGVPYGPAAYPIAMRTYLETLNLHLGPASILLNHVPSQLPTAEHAGVSLQLSGHTHGGGQMIPFNFLTRRAFGKFTYGLHQFGEMKVYTSSGAGTWGPPMRVGTDAEIVLLTFL